MLLVAVNTQTAGTAAGSLRLQMVIEFTSAVQGCSAVFVTSLSTCKFATRNMRGLVTWASTPLSQRAEVCLALSDPKYLVPFCC